MLSSRARRGQKTHTESCPRWRPDSATSARLIRSRHPTGTATGHPVCRGKMSPLSRLPRPPPLSGPRALVNLLVGHGKQLQKRSPEIGHVPSLLRSGTPLRWTPGPPQQPTLRRRYLTPPPPAPEWTAAAIPMTGYDVSRPLCLIVQNIPVFAMRTHPSGMLRMLPPGAPNAALSATPTAQHLSACPLQYPAAALRGALAVMLHEHHRDPDILDAPARCAGTSSLSGQPIAAQAAPGSCPGLSAPERNARHPSAAASSRAVGHRRIATGHLH